MILVYPIVEGHGEERALPELIRNFLHNKYEYYEFEILHPYRLPRDKMKKSDLLPVIELGTQRLKDRVSPGDVGLVLCVCDADDDCPVTLKNQIDRNVDTGNEQIHFAFVAADREYETWFLAAVNSFSNHQDCVNNLPAIDNLLNIRDAKGYFERHVLKDGRYYSETVDQAKFSSLIDFSLAPENNSRSLRRLLRIFERIIPV
jgi:hypothetical protein